MKVRRLMSASSVSARNRHSLETELFALTTFIALHVFATLLHQHIASLALSLARFDRKCVDLDLLMLVFSFLGLNFCHALQRRCCLHHAILGLSILCLHTSWSHLDWSSLGLDRPVCLERLWVISLGRELLCNHNWFHGSERRQQDTLTMLHLLPRVALLLLNFVFLLLLHEFGDHVSIYLAGSAHVVLRGLHILHLCIFFATHSHCCTAIQPR